MCRVHIGGRNKNVVYDSYQNFFLKLGLLSNNGRIEKNACFRVLSVMDHVFHFPIKEIKSERVYHFYLFFFFFIKKKKIIISLFASFLLRQTSKTNQEKINFKITIRW